MTYHNVRVFFSDNTASLYHNVTNYVTLIEYLERNKFFKFKAPVKAFIYRKATRKDKWGTYVGSWHKETGYRVA